MISSNAQIPSMASGVPAASSSDAPAVAPSEAPSEASSSKGTQRPAERSTQDKPRKEFENQVRNDDSADSAPAKKKSQTDAKETVRTKSDGAQKTMTNQILQQLVKQNPDAKPAALQFLQSQLSGAALEDLPQLMASSRFIADALMESDLSGYMSEDVKPSNVMRELGFNPDLITQAMALGVDASGSAQRGQVLAALGADPKRVESGLLRLKGAIAQDGVAGYMQQSLAMAKASGKQPDFMDRFTGTETEEAANDTGDFKSKTSLEMQAIMAQSMVSSNNWGPMNLAQPADANFLSLASPAPAVAVAVQQVAPPVAEVSFAHQTLETPATPETIDMMQFKSGLQLEFGDNVKVLHVGPDAWQRLPVLNSVSEAGSPTQATQLLRQIAAEYSGDVSSEDGEAQEIVAPDTVTKNSAPPELASLKTTGLDVAGPSKLEPRLSRESSKDKFEPARDLVFGDSLPVKSKESQDAPSTQSTAAEMVLERPSGIEGGFARETMKPTEAAEISAPDKAERSEVNARHASDTFRKIQDAVRRTSVSNIGAMRLDLSSPETGNLEITVRLNQNREVDVRVMAGSEELREMITRELPQLKASLGEQNLQLREFDSRSWSGPNSGPANQGWSGGFDERREGSPQSGKQSLGRGPSIEALNEQVGRQALRSFRIVDLSDRTVGGSGRIKVLA